MAEYLENKTLTSRLEAYAQGLGQGKNTRSHFDDFQDDLSQAGPYEVNTVIHRIVDQELSKPEPDLPGLKTLVARFIRACGTGLEQSGIPAYPPESPLAALSRDHRTLQSHLARVSAAIKDWATNRGTRAGIPELIQALESALTPLKNHYQTLQNEVFPRLEKTAPDHHRCVQLMWTIQDDVLGWGNEVLGLLKNQGDFHAINTTLGRFILDARSLIYREERILFPVVHQMAGFTWQSPGSTRPATPEPHTASGWETTGGQSPGLFQTPTGSLTAKQLQAIFKTLPVDITVIDPEDRVQYFSDTPDRVFPRSPGIIGRKVEDCHPPRSMHRVRSIVNDLKSRRKDKVQFWLNAGGTKVLIEYYALRDEEGRYLGTMECSQNIGPIQALSGEKRLEPPGGENSQEDDSPQAPPSHGASSPGEGRIRRPGQPPEAGV